MQVKSSLCKEPLVTVGIINYNYNKFLDQSINSVLNQDYESLEILIVDDFSTDGSIKKIKKYEEQYHNIRGIYHTENSGSAVLAFQEINKEAKGSFFTYLSADDYFANESVIKNYVNEFVNDNSLDYVYGDLQNVDINGKIKGLTKFKEYSDNEIIYNIFKRMGSGVIPFTTGMFKTDFCHRHNLIFEDDPDNRVAGDTLNTLIYLKYGWKRKYIDYPIICYRQHENNMTYDVKNRIKSIISVLEYIINNFDEEIYFPEIQWEQYETKEALKMYALGMFYWKTLMFYYNNFIIAGNINMSFDKEQMKEFIQPLIDVVEKYLNKSVSLNKRLTENTEKILSQMNQIKLPPQIISNPQKSYIYHEGQILRKNLLNIYRNKYADKKIKLLIYSPDNGAWKYDFQMWQNILEYMGINASIVYKIDNTTKFKDFNVLISIADKEYIKEILNNKSISKIQYKIGIASKEMISSCNNSRKDLLNLDLITKELKFDFLISACTQDYIGFIFKEWIDRGVEIKSIPFGFNPLIHYPEKALERYDYFFVGTNSSLKYHETKKYLLPILNKHKGILRGTQWGKNIPELYYKNVRYFYNRAKINLNYHLEVQKENENEINARTFIISACGGFQLVDNPKLLRKYYTAEEIATADDAKEYLEKYKYYLNKPKERHEMAYKAMVKTYENNCSLFHRLQQIIDSIL